MAYRFLNNLDNNDEYEDDISEDLEDFISDNNNDFVEDPALDDTPIDDYDVENYDIDTLFKFLNIDKDSTEFQIKDSANNLSAIMKNKKRNTLSVFFEEIRDKLLEWKKEERDKKNAKQQEAGLPLTFITKNTNNREYSVDLPNKPVDDNTELTINPDKDDPSSTSVHSSSVVPKTRFLLDGEDLASNIIMPIKRTITSIINIDTFFRSDYLNTDASNYIQELSEPINNVVKLSLKSVEIPNIWYSFSSERNSNFINITFRKFRYAYEAVNVNVVDEYDASYDIIIPDGNYTATEITNTMNNLFAYYAKTDKKINSYTRYNENNEVIQIENGFEVKNITDTLQNPINYLRMSIDPINGKTTFRIITNGYDYTSVEEEEVFGSSPYEPKKIDTDDNNVYSPDMTVEFNFLNESQSLLYTELTNRKYGIRQRQLNDEFEMKRPTSYDSNSIVPEKIMFDTAGWMLGFRNRKYIMTIKSTFFDPYTGKKAVTYKGFINSDGIYGGLVNTYIFLSVDDYNNNYKKNIITNNSENFVSNNNVLARIPVGSGSGTLMVQDTDLNPAREYFGPINLTKFRIKLLDRFGNILNINKNNYTLSFEVSQIY